MQTIQAAEFKARCLALMERVARTGQPLWLASKPSHNRRRYCSHCIKEVPLDGRIALLASSLDWKNPDPADHFIIATALHHEALLITGDKKYSIGNPA